MIISAGVSSLGKSFSSVAAMPLPVSSVAAVAKEPLRESLQTGRLPHRTSAFAMIQSNEILKQQKPYYLLSTTIRYSCGIDLGDYFVVTGGEIAAVEVDTVTRYSETGFDKDLAPLKQGRRLHACSKFVDQNGRTVCY